MNNLSTDIVPKSPLRHSNLQKHLTTDLVPKSPVLQSNLQKHLTRCENVIRPLSLDAARQRMENSQRSMSMGSVGDDEEMERKIIALDYRIQLDQCMAKSI